MAEVWVARRVGRRGKYVAIKVVLPHLSGQERFSRMFRTEAEVSSMLSHSNIVQVFDEGEDNGISFLVMEWVDGINLVRLREALALIEDAKIRNSIAAFVVGQLLHALSYAHSITSHEGEALGIVHRDVSPQNILISTSGDVKLTDFGVAHTLIEESSGMHIKGKLRYMAPEQLGGQTRSPSIDIYAAGAILTELIEGGRFRGDFEDDRVLHGQVMRGEIPPLTKPCPPTLERVRVALLEPDPAKRVRTADQALAMLRDDPGYRDMRLELSKICGSLTGVVRPRTGPAARGPAPARAQPAPAPAPVAAPRRAAGLPAAAAAPPAPMAGPGPLPAAAPPSAGGLAAAAVANAEHTVMLPNGGQLPGSGIAAGNGEVKTDPTTFLKPGVAPSAAAPPNRSTPHASAGSAAAFGAPAPAGVNPDATAFVAPSFPRESTHPSQRPRAATNPSAAVRFDPSVPLADDHSMTRFQVQERGKGSTALMFGVGLLLALGGAGLTAYFLIGRGGDSPDDSAKSSAKSETDKPDKKGEKKPDPKPAVVPEPALVIGEPETPEAVEPQAPDEPSEPEPEPETPEAVDPETVAAAEPEAASDPAPKSPKPATTKPRNPPKASSSPKAGSSKPSSPKSGGTKDAGGAPVIVHLRKEGVAAAWVKVAGRSVKVAAGANIKIRSGTHSVYKRHSESGSFKSCGKHKFGANKEWKLYVGSSSCRIKSF